MTKDYPKSIVTKDGQSVLLRPLIPEDRELLKEFFSQIPEEEHWFLREKLADPEVLEKWIEKLDHHRILPIVAVREHDGKIVGNLRLYRSGSPSFRHVAHLRVTVHPSYRQLKVGSWMILDCVKLALNLGIEKLFAEFVTGVEEAAIGAAHKLDFREVAVLKGYVKDPNGNYRDLIIMVKDLHRGWGDF
jgi:L-amino acid N-acyltransferase YncA